ncbi:TniQ family protein [Microcoleus sp. FACHB-1515]|uniref:TniQ family protein n=1 Tax=Leptolyngbya sp. FACHB-1515 TaxID=2933931 RepID=UPI0016861166|nr:TniQ family protein [Microcoleus sp. FACHB-1515]MBD2088612.1 TniQ family protein [Microcoleus sp. FACHB-1515]
MTSRTKLVYLEPYPGESLPHYLGRLRRLMGNNLPSATSLGEVIGVGAVVAQWEQGYLNPFPIEEQLAALGAAIGLEVDRLAQMLPSEKDNLDPRPIRLCGACYAECPCHQIKWQFKSRSSPRCDRHKLKLLMKCPGCETPFPIPSLWVEGRCPNEKCGMRYSRMAKHQKTVAY